MKLSNFIKLTVDDQAEAASKGVFLGEREAKPYIVFLFNLDNFFVEVFFNELQNRITRVKPFKSVRNLDPYLDTLNIEKF